MGPGARGIGAQRAPALGSQDALRWRLRIERAWGVTLREPQTGLRGELQRLSQELEEGLRFIDFAEVTDEDRMTFIESAVGWQVRQALRAGRFDLAVRLQALGARRIAGLAGTDRGWRPVLLRGARDRNPDGALARSTH